MNVDSVILDLGSSENDHMKKTWDMMGKPQLVWSPVQLRLANQARVSPIGRVPPLPVKVEGLKTYADFDVIEMVDENNSYPVLLGIGWANENLTFINFKKRVMTLENRDIQIIIPLDP